MYPVRKRWLRCRVFGQPTFKNVTMQSCTSSYSLQQRSAHSQLRNNSTTNSTSSLENNRGESFKSKSVLGSELEPNKKYGFENSKQEEIMNFLKNAYNEVNQHDIRLRAKQSSSGASVTTKTYKEVKNVVDDPETLLLHKFIEINKNVMKIPQKVYSPSDNVSFDEEKADINGDEVGVRDSGNTESLEKSELNSFFDELSSVNLRSNPEQEKKVVELFLVALNTNSLTKETTNKMLMALSNRYNIRAVQSAMEVMKLKGNSPTTETYNIFLSRLIKTKSEFKNKLIINEIQKMVDGGENCDRKTWLIIFRMLTDESNLDTLIKEMTRRGTSLASLSNYLYNVLRTPINSGDASIDFKAAQNKLRKLQMASRVLNRNEIIQALDKENPKTAYKIWQANMENYNCKFTDPETLNLFIYYSAITKLNIPLTISLINLFQRKFKIQKVSGFYAILTESLTKHRFFENWPLYAKLFYSMSIDSFSNVTMVSDETIKEINEIASLEIPGFDVQSEFTEKELNLIKLQDIKRHFRKLTWLDDKPHFDFNDNTPIYKNAVEALGFPMNY